MNLHDDFDQPNTAPGDTPHHKNHPQPGETAMNHKMLRQQAAQLARECRSIDRLGRWSIREWNNSVRKTVEIYMVNMIRFHKIHGTWENTKC